jgi:hypothetical protein
MSMVAYFAAVVLATPGATVPSLTAADKLVAPAHVDGAVFANADQIVALSSETANPTNGEKRCFLSVWDIQQKKWILTKPIDALSSSVSCGSLAYSSFLHRLLITANSELLLVSPQTLELERKISVRPNHIAAVREQEGTLYALSEQGYKPVTLTSYHLSTGALAQTKEFPNLDYNLDTHLRLDVISNEQLAVLQSDAKPLGVSERNSTLAICTRQDGTICKTVPIPMPVANFLVSGESLLFVSDDFADHNFKSRNQCIAKLSLTTLQVDSQAYCRRDAGVHYSIGTLGRDFVLGYSGYGARQGWLDDGLVVGKSSSISVWEAKSGRLIAIAPLPRGKSFTQSASVIRADTSGKKRFLFYNPMEGREILLYDLSSLG